MTESPAHDAPERRPRSDVAHGPDPRLVDAVLAVGIALAVALVVAADLQGTGRGGGAACLFVAGFGLLVLGRRRWPRAVVVLTVLGIFAYYIADLPPIGIALPAVAALYSAAELDRTRWAVAAGVVLVAVAGYFRVREGQPTSYLYGYELLTNVALVAAAIALGAGVRLAAESRVQAERVRRLGAAAQASAADRRLEAERLRIARDLHDAVGHSIAVIAVHTGVAEDAVGHDDDAASRALGHVRAAASTSLHQLRRTVRLLRSPVATEDEGVGLAGLDHLAASVAEAGLTLTRHVRVPPGALDPVIDAAAYRIVQEAVTNVLRHSGARTAEVSAVVAGGRLRLAVVDDGGAAGAEETARGDDGGTARGDDGGTARGNDGETASGENRGRPTAPAPSTSGQGLVGIRERAALLAGRCDAGPRGTGWAVRVELPTRGAS